MAVAAERAAEEAAAAAERARGGSGLNDLLPRDLLRGLRVAVDVQLSGLREAARRAAEGPRGTRAKQVVRALVAAAAAACALRVASPAAFSIVTSPAAIAAAAAATSAAADAALAGAKP